jgi:hypothetical protein
MEIRGSLEKLPLTSKRGSAMYLLESQYLKVFAGRNFDLSPLQNLVPKHSFIDKKNKETINNPTKLWRYFELFYFYK